MKKFMGLIALTAIGLTVSCSGDDNNSSGGDTTAVYLPLSQGNYWVYDTNNQGADGAADSSGRDSLYVANDTVIGTATYTKFKTQAAPTGFYSGSLSGNAVRASGNKLLVTGSTSLALSEDIPFSITINDFAFFDADASTGDQIGSTSGSFQQTIEEIPLAFTYTLKTTAANDVATLTVNGENYTNLKTVVTTLRLKIAHAVFGIVLLQEQDVVVSNQYFAEGVGVVKTSTDIEYTLADFSSLGVTLPIPQSGSAHQDEELDTYNIE
ncbi:hypothetical protein ACLI09_08435 [Flavobacterium sp. RHBU_24]|uniref:hypothetical protein n=1 Tax=Flavobacterium sp. RHBU_24 TaxID=3391185 RepID=UPI00398497E0